MNQNRACTKLFEHLMNQMMRKRFRPNCFAIATLTVKPASTARTSRANTVQHPESPLLQIFVVLVKKTADEYAEEKGQGIKGEVAQHGQRNGMPAHVIPLEFQGVVNGHGDPQKKQHGQKIPGMEFFLIKFFDVSDDSAHGGFSCGFCRNKVCWRSDFAWCSSS